MRKRIGRRAGNFFRKEGGNFMVIFALVFPVILMLVGMTVDLCMVEYKRLKLEQVGQVLREIRFETQPLYTNALDPETTLNGICKEYAVKNGLDADQVSVEWGETYTMSGRGGTCTRRDGTIVITLTDSYEYTFMKVFGFDKAEIDPVVINGTYYISNSGGVWYPGLG